MSRVLSFFSICTMLLAIMTSSEAFISSSAQLTKLTVNRLSLCGLKPTISQGSSHNSWRSSAVRATAKDGQDEKKENKLPFLLDPGTKGGALFLGLILFIVPIILYNISLSMGLDMIDANRIFGIGFTVLLSLAWVSTYIFRVATKDMTYAKQLKDYENAVMQKRLEELDEDEVQALMEEVDRDAF